MDYKYKYEKYKIKNNKFKYLLNREYGSNTDSDGSSLDSNTNSHQDIEIFYDFNSDKKIMGMFELFDVDLSDDDVNYFFKHVKKTISTSIVDDAQRFIKLCDFVETQLNNLSKNKILDVIAPGDSSTKIIEYFKKLNKCKKCNFKTFPFSGRNEIFSTDYLESKLPNELDNFVIIDYIETGKTMMIIADAIENKFGSNNVTDEIRDFINGKINETKYILDLDNDFTHIVWDYIIWAERTYTRCTPYNDQNINIDSEQEKYDKSGCMFFVYIAVLCTLYPDIANIYLYNEKIDSTYYNYKLTDNELNFLAKF